MKDAKKSAAARIRQLKRQKMEWFAENTRDQGDYVRLLAKEASKEDEIAAAQVELEAIRVQARDKAGEMVGENREQLAKFDELIREAEEMFDSI